MSGRVIGKFLSVKRLDGFVLCIRRGSDSSLYNSYLLLCMDNNLDHSFERNAPLHGQETSTDPWSYLKRLANVNEKKLLNK